MSGHQSIDSWRARGRTIRIGQLDIFVVDAGPRVERAVFVLHGFPVGCYTWNRIYRTLLTTHRVVLFDLPGFGLSSKPADYGYSLAEQADVAEKVAARTGLKRVDLLAHDMGTSIASELVARRRSGRSSLDIGSLMMLNGAPFGSMIRPTLAQTIMQSPHIGPIFARMATRDVFTTQIRRMVARPLPRGELDMMWRILEHRGGRARLPQLIRYAGERDRLATRWRMALSELDCPATVVWGDRDPVSLLNGGEELARLIPHARFRRLPGLGHYPHLEDPEATAALALAFLAQVGRG